MHWFNVAFTSPTCTRSFLSTFAVNIPILFKSRIDNSSVSILLDIQSALLYLDDDSLKTIYLVALLWKPENELTKNTLLEAIKLTEAKKKLFNSDLDTTKDF